MTRVAASAYSLFITMPLSCFNAGWAVLLLFTNTLIFIRISIDLSFDLYRRDYCSKTLFCTVLYFANELLFDLALFNNRPLSTFVHIYDACYCVCR